jgi:hypothetical protein
MIELNDGLDCGKARDPMASTHDRRESRSGKARPTLTARLQYPRCSTAMPTRLDLAARATWALGSTRVPTAAP